MKSNFVLLCIVMLAAFAPRACADAESEKAAAAQLLVSGPWKFTTKTSSDVRVFSKDGTFTTTGKTDEDGEWTISRDFIILIYANGHKDAVYMPLNPKGTKGLADNGDEMNAVLQRAAPAATPAPAHSPAPVAGDRPGATPAVYARPKGMSEALLLSKPWKFLGGWSYEVRVFAEDGTFKTIANEKESGKWEFADRMIVLTFEDGHKETISLPLNSRGTQGLDRDGGPVTIWMAKAPAGRPALGDVDTLAMSDRERNAVISLLVSAPWRFTGGSWSQERMFGRNGAFSTIGHPKEFGIWRISGDKILMTYQDGHNDTMSLPLDPKGTDCMGKDGAPVLAVLQTAPVASGTPTPAPAAGATPSAPTPSPAGAQAPGAPH